MLQIANICVEIIQVHNILFLDVYSFSLSVKLNASSRGFLPEKQFRPDFSFARESVYYEQVGYFFAWHKATS